MPVRKEFWSHFDGGENRLWHMKKGFTEYIIAMILKYKPRKCLDIGCGSGYYVKELRKRNIDAFGIDISKKAITKSPKGFCKVGDALNLSFKPDTFDFVFSILLLEHISDKRKLFLEMKRVLKPHGKALILYPNKKSVLVLYIYFIRKLQKLLGKPVPEIHNLYTANQIKKDLDELGFNIVDTSYVFTGKFISLPLKILDILFAGLRLRGLAEEVIIVAEKR